MMPENVSFMSCVWASHLMSFLEDYQVKSNLDKHKKRTKEILAKEIRIDDYGSIISSTTRPLSISFISRKFQCLVITLSACLLISAILKAYVASTFLPIKGKHFKFDLMSILSNSNSSTLVPLFLYESLICQWPQAFYNSTVRGREHVISFQNEVRITGWTLQGHGGSSYIENQDFSVGSPSEANGLLSQDVRASLYRSADGSHWDLLQPPWLEIQPFPTKTYTPSLQVDLSPPLWWILHSVASPIALAGCCIAAAYAGSRCDGRLAARLLSLGWLASSVAHLAALLAAETGESGGGGPPGVAACCLLSATYAFICFVERGVYTSLYTCSYPVGNPDSLSLSFSPSLFLCQFLSVFLFLCLCLSIFISKNLSIYLSICPP